MVPGAEQPINRFWSWVLTTSMPWWFIRKWKQSFLESSLDGLSWEMSFRNIESIIFLWTVKGWVCQEWGRLTDLCIDCTHREGRMEVDATGCRWRQRGKNCCSKVKGTEKVLNGKGMRFVSRGCADSPGKELKGNSEPVSTTLLFHKCSKWRHQEVREWNEFDPRAGP